VHGQQAGQSESGSKLPHSRGHKRERDVGAQATFDKYLNAIVKATEEVDRRLAAPPAKG
jgi:hypothetical protein